MQQVDEPGDPAGQTNPLQALAEWDEKFVSVILEVFAPWMPEWLFHVTRSLPLICLILLVSLIFGVWSILSCFLAPKNKVKAFIAPGAGPRFRKRDRLEFSARKTMRSARALGSYIRGGQGRKRRDMARIVKKVLLRHPDREAQETLRDRPELPAKFLEEEEVGSDRSEEISILAGISSWARELEKKFPELIKLLQNLRVFGHLESSIFQELYRNLEPVTIRKGENLFHIGDPDENMYIVQSGALSVLYEFKAPAISPAVTEAASGGHIELKKVRQGESIVSLLSFLDYIAGCEKRYKTVWAKADVDTKVIKVSFKVFKDAFEKHPDSLVNVVQVVMIRLQRVTLLALNQYLGIGPELINQRNRGSELNPTTASEPQSPLMSLNGAAFEDFRDETHIRSKSDAALKSLAEEAFKYYLGLSEDPSKEDEDNLQLGAVAENVLCPSSKGENVDLSSEIEFLSLAEGQNAVEENSEDGDRLAIVLYGCFGVSQKNENGTSREIHRAYAGGLLGQLQVLTAEPSFFTYTALADSRIAYLDGLFIRRHLMKQFPYVSVHLAMSVMKHLSPYVRSIDFALEWMMLESGKALYKQNNQAESIYVVLSGRLRGVVTEDNDKKHIVAEYARGDLTGMVETLTQKPRHSTVIAVRDTELAKLPAGLIELIKMRFPSVLVRLMRLLGEELQNSWQRDFSDGLATSGLGLPPKSSNLEDMQLQIGSHMTNFSTVAIIANSPYLPITAFSLELIHALNSIDPCLRLTRNYVKEELGPNAFDKSSDIKLTNWLTHQEDKHRVVLFVCEPETGGTERERRERHEWNKLCIRLVDAIFILVEPQGPAAVTALELELKRTSPRARKDLIFIHKEDTKYPEGSAKWLHLRPWYNGHHHIRCSARMFFKKKCENIERMYAKRVLGASPADIHSDFSRLARFVTASTVGLVLGGGGARGCAHVGMIKSILEAGIPIDQVGGVSIGALMGGIYCQERDSAALTVRARSVAYKLAQIWRQILDLTYPYAAYFTGHGFNRLIEEVFGERDIRDLWIPFFTITTDITNSSMRIHDVGSLWRYVRASMSLAGYLPPLCDPRDGHLLLDGGYVNNLPADIMRKVYGAKHSIAIDVGALDDVNFTNYGDELSGFRVLMRKWLPFQEPMLVPNQTEIQSRLAYVSCVGKLEQGRSVLVCTVKNAEYCDYIRPPIDKYGTLQFKSFDEVREVGYNHGQTFFAGLKKYGGMSRFLNRQFSSDHHRFFHLRRRSSCENVPGALSSSLESQAGFFFSSSAPSHSPVSNLAEMMVLSSSSANHTPIHQPYTLKAGQLDKAVCGPSSPSKSLPEVGAARVGELGDDELTSEDSANLISDEEEDAESGFLSQI